MKKLFLLTFVMFSFGTFAQSGGGFNPNTSVTHMIITDFIPKCTDGSLLPIQFSGVKYTLSFYMGPDIHWYEGSARAYIQGYLCDNGKFPSTVKVLSATPILYCHTCPGNDDFFVVSGAE